MSKKEIDDAKVKFDTLWNEFLKTMDEKKDLLSNRVMEITMGINGTISTAPYENWKPGFGMKVNTEGLTKEQIREVYLQGKAELKGQFNLEKNNCKAEVIEEKWANIGFSEKDNLKYVWITSVLNYDTVWRIPEFELTQHGSRGTIIHEIAHDYVRKVDELRKKDPELKEIAKIEWLNPEEVKTLESHVAILLNGSLKMHWNDCSVKAFLKEYAKKITNPEIEVKVWNDEHRYTGRMDMFCGWDGVSTIVDYKSGANTGDFRQLAAGAVCREGIEQMVICPVGPTDNKIGYQKPKISTDIAGEFKLFVKKRQQFRKEFGI
jgi:hypothetical protein